MADYTVDKLVDDIKRHGSIPTSQTLVSDDDIVKMMDHNQRQRLIPGIMRVREENFVQEYIIDLVGPNAPAFDQNKPKFALPERSIGGKVRSIWVVDAAGNERQLPRIEPENKQWHENDLRWPDSKGGYRFEGNKIILAPNMQSAYTQLKIMIFRRPGSLTLSENCAQVVSANTTTGVVTVSSVPDAFTSGMLLDCISNTPNFDSLADSEEVLAMNTTANTITVSTETSALLNAGDWLCPEKQTCVPQYAEEFASLLVNYTVEDILKTLGDLQGAQAVMQESEELERMLHQTGANRDEGSPRKVVSRRGIFDTGGW